MLVALGVFALVAGIVFSVFSWFGRAVNTEGDTVDLQQAARTALDEMARSVRQAGFGVERLDPYNATLWQKEVVHAGPHTLAFNADLDPAVGPLAPSEILALPGATYRGEGASATADGAETWVYSLDADGDGQVSADDRAAVPPGAYNPALETESPLDFAVFRRVHGWDGAGYGGTVVPVAGGLFTNAVPDARFPDGTTPDPLFAYWLTEDLDGDGTLDGAECVVAPCPPPTPRGPTLYLWGDTNGDGSLDEAEKVALGLEPVGSPAWAKNPLASAGALRGTVLVTGVDPSDPSAAVLRVADASGFAAGHHVRVGTGETGETFVLESADSGTNELRLASSPLRPHAAADPVSVLPQTLLRAIRTVQIQYASMAKRADTRAGEAAAGRMGRRGARGLDHRVETLVRSVELVNLETAPIASAEVVAPPPSCPVTIAFDCSGSAPDRVAVYVPAASPTALRFRVAGPGGVPMKGVPVEFAQSSPGMGSLSARTTKTAADGLAAVDYSPTAVLGSDMVTATATCVDASERLVRTPTQVTVETARLRLETASDCISTVHAKNPSSSTDFTLQVENSGGLVANVPVRVGLAFESAYLPGGTDASRLEAELVLGARSAGTTDATGRLEAVEDTTGSSGILAGQVLLRRDDAGLGARLDLVASAAAATCGPAGAPVEAPLTYYLLSLDSETPRSGCTEVAPCTIAAGSVPPTLAARLSVAGQPASNAIIEFTPDDRHAGNGQSILLPGRVVSTDASGVARVQVANSADGTVTPANPLTTLVDAASSGDPSFCGAGRVVLASLRSEFRFEGTAGQCDTEMRSSWLSRVGTANDRICMAIRNANAATGCPIRVTGLAVKVYRSDGITPDNVFRLERLEGGAVVATRSCATTGKVTLFAPGCNGNAFLPNGQRWDFIAGSGCALSPQLVPPGSYFVLNLADFTAALAGTGRPLDVTVHYRCEAPCPAGLVASRTFRLTAPPTSGGSGDDD
jgi:type II secretory pathway pseudopilin PulG